MVPLVWIDLIFNYLLSKNVEVMQNRVHLYKNIQSHNYNDACMVIFLYNLQDSRSIEIKAFTMAPFLYYLLK